MEGLSYLLLGPLEVRRGSVSVPVGAGKPLELLALLLIERNHALSTDSLVEQLWDGRPPETAVKIVQNAVSALRRAFGDGADEVLVTRGHGYELVVPPGATDVDRFQALVERGRAELAGGDADQAVATLRIALALWRGEPLADVAYHALARDEIARLQEQRLAAIEERIDAEFAAGGGAGLVAELEQLVGRNPLRERLRGQLMLALYRSGRQARALEVYAEGRRELSEQLGIEPAEELKRLERSILGHDHHLGGPRRRPPPVPRHRVSRRVVMAGVGVLAAAAVVAGLVVSRGGRGVVSIAAAPGDTVALVDPSTGHLMAEYPVGHTPTRLVTAAGVAWSLNADDRTISRIDLQSGRVRTVSPGATPVDLTVGGGWLWVSVVTSAGSRPGTFTATLERLDETTLAVSGRIRLPGIGTSGAQGGGSVPLAYAGGKVWAGGPALVAVDPVRLHVTNRARGVPSVESLATGLGSLWAAGGGSVATLSRIDPRSARVVQRIYLPATSPGPVAVGAGAIWMTDPGPGRIWRIHPGPPVHTRSLAVGAGALGLAAVGDAVWVSGAVDGTLSRVSANGRSGTSRIAVGGIPEAVAVDSRGVLVAVAGGDGLQADSTDSTSITSVSGARCGAVVHGTASPQFLIVADLPVTGDMKPQGLPMSQAILYELRTHDFRAGRYRLGYQVCDDVSPVTEIPDTASCSTAAGAYARTASVIGMIGPFTSLCAVEQLATLNRAGPLAAVSPSNSDPGLTHGGPGEQANEPERFRPTGLVSYARVIPADDLQGVAAADLAQTFGLHRVYVYRSSWFTPDYPAVVADAFAIAAGQQGIQVIGPATPSPAHTAAVVARLKAQGVDGIFVSGGTQLGTGGTNTNLQSFLAAARRAIPGITLIGDAGLSTPPTPPGMYIAAEGVFDPGAQLLAPGVRFVRAFGLTQPGGEVSAYSANAAQAAEVLLAAIAHSDGTRASVTRALLKVSVTDGILGSFGFDRNGDMTTNLIPVVHDGRLAEVLQVHPLDAGQ